MHILSHGEQGSLRLGNATLDAASMQGEYRDELQAIGRALSANGDILTYGCDFAQFDRGEQAVKLLAEISAADVAANGVALTGGAQAIAVANGTVNIDAAGAISFTPAANYNGPVSFDYVMADLGGLADTGTVSIDVIAVNDPPVALDDTATAPHGTSTSGQVLGNDSDADGDPLSVSAIALDSNGDGVAESFAVPPGSQVTVPITDANGNAVGTLVVGADGSYTFTAQPGYAGPVPPVTITVSDGQGQRQLGAALLRRAQPAHGAQAAGDADRSRPATALGAEHAGLRPRRRDRQRAGADHHRRRA